MHPIHKHIREVKLTPVLKRCRKSLIGVQLLLQQRLFGQISSLNIYTIGIRYDYEMSQLSIIIKNRIY